MISSTLQHRLRQIERQRLPAIPLQATALVVSHIEAAAPLLAEREAAGTYKPSWPLIVLAGRPLKECQP